MFPRGWWHLANVSGYGPERWSPIRADIAGIASPGFTTIRLDLPGLGTIHWGLGEISTRMGGKRHEFSRIGMRVLSKVV
jgi:hypothetical protein